MTDKDIYHEALERCEGFLALRMWNEAWEELDRIPESLYSEIRVVGWRIYITCRTGTHEQSEIMANLISREFPRLIPELMETAKYMHDVVGGHPARELLCLTQVGALNYPEFFFEWAKLEARWGETNLAKKLAEYYLKLLPEGELELSNCPELRDIWES